MAVKKRQASFFSRMASVHLAPSVFSVSDVGPNYEQHNHKTRSRHDQARHPNTTHTTRYDAQQDDAYEGIVLEVFDAAVPGQLENEARDVGRRHEQNEHRPVLGLGHLLLLGCRRAIYIYRAFSVCLS
jgi:hypothetical protein